MEKVREQDRKLELLLSSMEQPREDQIEEDPDLVGKSDKSLSLTENPSAEQFENNILDSNYVPDSDVGVPQPEPQEDQQIQ